MTDYIQEYNEALEIVKDYEAKIEEYKKSFSKKELELVRVLEQFEWNENKRIDLVYTSLNRNDDEYPIREYSLNHNEYIRAKNFIEIY